VRAHKLRCGALPAPSQAELDQLVADFLARRFGVTRCPTVCVLPVQNGDGPHGRPRPKAGASPAPATAAPRRSEAAPGRRLRSQ